MSIIDQARDAEVCQYAAAVVRVADLADELDAEATAGTAFYELHDERVAGKYDAAARIRAALEGVEE